MDEREIAGLLLAALALAMLGPAWTARYLLGRNTLCEECGLVPVPRDEQCLHDRWLCSGCSGACASCVADLEARDRWAGVRW